MPKWNNPVVTNKGRALLAKVQTGTPLELTRMAVGAGKPSDLKAATKLADERLDLTISSSEVIDQYNAQIYGLLNNSKLRTGFSASELGVFANDPDEGEILYLIVTDEMPDFIPDQNNMLTQRIGITLQFENATSITVKLASTGSISPSDTKALIDESLKKHREKTPLDHPDRSVLARHLAKDSVTTEKIVDRNVTESKLAVSAVTDTIIGNRTITDTQSSRPDTNTIGKHLNSIGSVLKLVTGESKWSSAPLINLNSTKSRLDSLDNTKLNADIIGNAYGKVPTLNQSGKWDNRYLPDALFGDYVPKTMIGTSSGNIATLDTGGRFNKLRLPSDVIYSGDFQTLMGLDGYTKFPGGLIIQWGSFGQGTYHGTKLITFKTRFSAVYSIVITPTDPLWYGEDNGPIHATNVTNSGFTAAYAGDQSTSPGGYWIAIGR